MSLLPCQQGQVVTLRITTGQLELIARALNRVVDLSHDTFCRSLDEQDEMEAIAACCKDTIAEPGTPDTVHGFAL